MLCSFVERHGMIRPLTCHSSHANLGMEFHYGARVLADKLLRDQSLLFDAVIDPNAFEYRSMLRRRNKYEQRFFFERLNSPVDYKVSENMKAIFELYDSNTIRLELEHHHMNRRYRRVEYMAAAIQGFPDDPSPSWWRRVVTRRWARYCERNLFGSEELAGIEDDSGVHRETADGAAAYEGLLPHAGYPLIV